MRLSSMSMFLVCAAGVLTTILHVPLRVGVGHRRDCGTSLVRIDSVGDGHQHLRVELIGDVGVERLDADEVLPDAGVLGIRRYQGELLYSGLGEPHRYFLPDCPTLGSGDVLRDGDLTGVEVVERTLGETEVIDLLHGLRVTGNQVVGASVDLSAAAIRKPVTASSSGSADSCVARSGLRPPSHQRWTTRPDRR